MAEELEELWKKLSFTEEEVDDVELGRGSTKAAIERGKYYAVLKVLTHRSISLDALRKNLRMVRKLKKEMQFSEIEEDLFLVEFGDEKDNDRRKTPAKALQNNGELQYGAWLRGEPMRRGNKDLLRLGKEGGLEGGGVTRARSEMEKTYLAETEVVHETSTRTANGSQGLVAMLFDAKVGWTAEILGPNSKHWKLLARESKGKSASEGCPESKKPNGQTPLQELDPNVVDQKKRKGTNQRKLTLENEEEMVSGEVEATTQPCQAQ
nr:hypothetical protein CFP56_59426 [Quercus suber]